MASQSPKTKKSAARAAISTARKVRSEQTADRRGVRSGRPPSPKNLSSKMFASDEILAEGEPGWEKIVEQVKEIAQLEMLGEFPKDIEKKTRLSYEQIEDLRREYPSLFEKCRAQIMETIGDRFTVNYMRAYEMVGAFSPDAVRTLKDIMLDPDEKSTGRKDAAKAILSFAADLIADKAVKRSGAQHPPEIKELAKRAQDIMGQGKKPAEAPKNAIDEEPN